MVFIRLPKYLDEDEDDERKYSINKIIKNEKTV